jgi:hypothetical protein
MLCEVKCLKINQFLQYTSCFRCVMLIAILGRTLVLKEPSLFHATYEISRLDVLGLFENISEGNVSPHISTTETNSCITSVFGF